MSTGWLSNNFDAESDSPSPRLLRKRELGGRKYSPIQWRRAVEEYRLSTLRIIGTIPVVFSSPATATALDIDRNDHDFLLAGSARGSIDVFNLRFKDPLKERPVASVELEHSKMINACQWIPSGIEMFATASQDGTVKTYDLNERQPFDTFKIENPQQMHWNEIDRRNPLIAVANETSNVVLIDLRKGSCDQNIRNKTTVTAVRWMPTERVLCTGDVIGTLKYWDIRKASTPLKKFQVSPELRVAAIRFTSDGRHLVCVDGCQRKVHVLDALTFERIHMVDAAYKLEKHIHPNSRNMCLAEDGKYLRIAVPSTAVNFAWITLDLNRPSLAPHVSFLAGQMQAVGSCVYRPGHQQLLTSTAGMIVNWSSEGERAVASLKQKKNRRKARADNWSDDEGNNEDDEEDE